MGASVLRGGVLVALAVLLGFLVLRGTTPRTELPIGVTTAAAATEAPTPTPEPTTEVGVAELPTPDTVLDTSTARPNAQISVLVANGTDVSGQAGRLTDVLRNQGFDTKQAKNADPRAASVIWYRPGFSVEAEVVRQALNTSTPIASMPEPDPVVGTDIDLGNVDVFVLVGADALSQS
ncbi:MAG: LytR C-terminal domain-containing protein [Actinomycetota bacterium]